MKSFTIRITDELNKWLEEQAKREHRNKNNLVVHLLENARQDWIDQFPLFPSLNELLTIREEEE